MAGSFLAHFFCEKKDSFLHKKSQRRKSDSLKNCRMWLLILVQFVYPMAKDGSAFSISKKPVKLSGFF